MTLEIFDVFDAAWRVSWQAAAIVSLVAGVTSHHLIFRRFEVDGYAWQLLFIFLGSSAVLIIAHIRIGGYSLILAICRALLVSNAYNAGVVVSSLTYRAFFHPLNRFPGPFMAKLSRFYAMRNAAKSLKAFEDIQRLHETYGDIVRVGARELSINRASAIGVIYETPTRTTRSPWYAQVSNDVTKISLNSTRVLKVHKLRKKIWERGLGFRALAVYAPRIKTKVDLLLAKIAEHSGRPIDVTEYSMFFAFDVMGEIGFSKDFHMLESETEHPAIKGVHESMLAIGVLGTVPWLLSMISKVPGAAAGFSRFTTWCHQQLQEKPTLKDQGPRDIISWLIKAVTEGDPSAPPGEMAIQEDARLLIIAGSDTTSAALANALYYLASNPRTYRRLQASLRDQFPGGVIDWSYEKNIPYLDYVINETLRLKPSVPGGLPRVTPPEGLMIDDEFIPGGTVMAVPTFTVQRDPRFWADANAFKPERWEGLSTEKSPWIPFTRGQWACPGRNLAMMEMRMVLSRIALRYNVSFADEDAAKRFDADVMDTFTLTLPPLHLVFTPI
ncbi:cytochrome P450 [Trichoderma citrinoviride]|uniref:Cytochrome P450 n=1 Tax=Trichoderma citrinoviride TaxID=58853 RepID=A0A2T4B6R1_9HYPO|nr:cytochrome P450 [Trichoderma citrinoviride]PTB64968.1 cytochrome P450 [Trichoderma citrinoviride]